MGDGCLHGFGSSGGCQSSISPGLFDIGTEIQFQLVWRATQQIHWFMYLRSLGVLASGIAGSRCSELSWGTYSPQFSLFSLLAASSLHVTENYGHQWKGHMSYLFINLNEKREPLFQCSSQDGLSLVYPRSGVQHDVITGVKGIYELIGHTGVRRCTERGGRVPQRKLDIIPRQRKSRWWTAQNSRFLNCIWWPQTLTLFLSRKLLINSFQVAGEEWMDE